MQIKTNKQKNPQNKPTYHACAFGRSGHDIVMVKEGKVGTFG